MGLHESTVERIANIYERTKSKTERFIIESGLRQGGVLAPLLFITVMRNTNKGR